MIARIVMRVWCRRLADRMLAACDAFVRLAASRRQARRAVRKDANTPLAATARLALISRARSRVATWCAVRKDADTTLAAAVRLAFVRRAHSRFEARRAVWKDGDASLATAARDVLVRLRRVFRGIGRASHAIHYLRALVPFSLSLHSRCRRRRNRRRQRERPAARAVGASKTATSANDIVAVVKATLNGIGHFRE
jgi:hypothetical protein